MTDELKIMAEVVSAHGDPEAFGERELVAVADIQKLPYRTKLCRHDEAMAEIERLRAENERLQRLFTHAGENLDVCMHHLSEARNKALDEAAALLDEADEIRRPHRLAATIRALKVKP